jgi:hypothetical protein
MRPYVYLLFAHDGDLCGLDVSEHAADAVAAARARGLLTPVSDAQRVEIWRDGELRACVGAG